MLNLRLPLALANPQPTTPPNNPTFQELTLLHIAVNFHRC